MILLWWCETYNTHTDTPLPPPPCSPTILCSNSNRQRLSPLPSNIFKHGKLDYNMINLTMLIKWIIILVGQPNCSPSFKISNETHADDKYDYSIIYVLNVYFNIIWSLTFTMHVVAPAGLICYLILLFRNNHHVKWVFPVRELPRSIHLGARNAAKLAWTAKVQTPFWLPNCDSLNHLSAWTPLKPITSNIDGCC